MKTLCLSALAAVFALVIAPPAHAASPLPNVVLILSDDQGHQDVGSNGSIIDTPSIDSIAADGLTLERYYTYPTCGPTRVGMMTARNPIRLGLTGNINEGEDGVPLDEHFISETFDAAGYQTWALGKWHLGGTTGPEYLAHNRGFDHFYGFVGGSINETTHETPGSGVLDWQRNGTAVVESGFSTDLLTDEAISLIENRDPNAPFFLYLTFHAVHTPYDAPQALSDKYALLGLSGDRLDYAAMVENMDANIGRVLDTLDSESIAADTLVVFVSDNGGDEDKGALNDPLSGGKNTGYEGGVRVLGMARWPGVLTASSTTGQYVTHLDWLPTLAAAAGIPVGATKPVDGENVWPALVSGLQVAHAPFVVRRTDNAVVEGQWKWLHDRDVDIDYLFNIIDDPNEATDRSLDFPAILADLMATFNVINGELDNDADWIVDTADPCTVTSSATPPSDPPDQNPSKLRLTLKKLDEAPGDQRMVAKGTFNPAAGVPTIDPSINGAHVLIEDASGTVYDVSVPGGLEGTSPCDDADGWRVTTSSTKTRWRYTNKSGGLPDGIGGCIAGAAAGLNRFDITDKTASSKQAFQFKVKAKDATFTSIPALPLDRIALNVSLGAESAPGLASAQAQAGQCAEFEIEGLPAASSSPKPYCKLSPATGAAATIKCIGQ